jgi:hypothetical protein
MPCDTVTTISLDIKNADMAIMKKVLEDKGYTIIAENVGVISFSKGSYYNQGRFIKETGEVIMTGRADMAWLKPAYTQEFVQQKVRKFGWKVKQVSDNKFQVIKR